MEGPVQALLPNEAKKMRKLRDFRFDFRWKEAAASIEQRFQALYEDVG